MRGAVPGAGCVTLKDDVVNPANVWMGNGRVFPGAYAAWGSTPMSETATFRQLEPRYLPRRNFARVSVRRAIRFILTERDGQGPGGGDVDRFRIKI